jgi:hypothetical protein
MAFMIIKNGAFLIRGRIFLISGVSEGFETNENGVAQEVCGTFVKSSDRSSKRKMFVQKFGEITKLYLFIM